ncbi:meiotically up-regulated gene 113-domain-containing protein [Phaeosphaeriaceae sp. PMI808]|nr:meiotically up-regulated gene 113-domain-containing protein [Phaeosphaeriaceae sp. PMI808]
MAFTGRTPESLIPRSDSRNPATTCKGITKSGRPCRRPIDAKASQYDGVLAVVSVVSDEDDEEIGAAAYFCWQHKDQAEQLAAQTSGGPATHLYPLKERNSIDTLVERLGVLEVNEPAVNKRRRESRTDDHKSTSRPPRRINRPPTWDNVEGPLISIPSDVMAAEKRRTRPPKPPPRTQKSSFWASLCCGSADDDHVEVIRHKKRTSHTPTISQYAPDTSMQHTAQISPPVHHGSSRRSSATVPKPHSEAQLSSNMPDRKPLGAKTVRPLNKTAQGNSETSVLLRYIPQTLSPQLTSTLLAELSKPISPHDDEGYIYIFWLTPDAQGPAPSSTASTLLAPPSRSAQGRRTSDVLRQYSVKKPQRPDTTRRRSNSSPATALSDTILLKIGRANNVHRRMNEWTRQCGYSLSLVRYYPYVPSTPTPSPQTSPAQSRRPSYGSRPSDGVRKVPHAHRVERLIHLELGAQRVIKDCEACGKTHKEWFEVEASKEGVKKVDDVVKRWVEWAERANE